MPKYVFAYHGGSAPQDPAEGAKVMEAWMAWFGELGAAVVDGGAPTGQSKTIAAGGAVSDGGGANPISGYSVIERVRHRRRGDAGQGLPAAVVGRFGRGRRDHRHVRSLPHEPHV